MSIKGTKDLMASMAADADANHDAKMAIRMRDALPRMDYLTTTKINVALSEALGEAAADALTALLVTT